MHSFESSADMSGLPLEIVLTGVLQFVDESERKFFCVNRFFAQYLYSIRKAELNNCLKHVIAELGSLGIDCAQYQAEPTDMNRLVINVILLRLREVIEKVSELNNHHTLDKRVADIIAIVNTLEKTIKSAPREALHAMEKVVPSLSREKIFPFGLVNHCYEILRARLKELGREGLLNPSR